MSDIPKFGVYKGMMTSHEESIVSKVEYNDENREKLAEAVVENMELKDMVQALYEQGNPPNSISRSRKQADTIREVQEVMSKYKELS